MTWRSPAIRVTGVENLNDETLGAIENGITVGWLVPKIGPDIEPKRMFTSTVAGPLSVRSRRLTKFREVKVGVNDWPKGEKFDAF